MDGVHDLLRSPIFDGLSSDDLEVLCSHSRVLSFEAGHSLFESGQKAEELMILREGVVELFFPIHILGAAREVTLKSKQTGDVVAWSACVISWCRLALSFLGSRFS
ncbi:MAG: cyclic nucleotide-binding domain-containing protein, partial [Planctomycetota bacterium]